MKRPYCCIQRISLLFCLAVVIFSDSNGETLKLMNDTINVKGRLFQDSVISVILNHATKEIKADLNTSKSKVSYLFGTPFMVTIPSKANPKIILFSVVLNGGMSSRWVEGFGEPLKKSNKFTVWAFDKKFSKKNSIQMGS